jgi:large subunit ribosomal protein L15
MQINELQVRKKKNRKTIGRGGKRGTYSGKGCNGQKARSGAHVDPLFEGGRSSLTERLKKVKGFKSAKLKKINLNLNDIERNFKENDTINIESLIKAGLIDKIEAKRGVKILGDGKLTKKVTVDKEILLSTSAKKAIE